MPDIVIKEVPQSILDELERQAKKNKRSLEQELLFVLQRAADLSRLDDMKMDT
jgi:hypothetical protein